MKNRFVLQFSTIPGATDSDPEEKLAFVCHTATRPSVSFNEVVHHRLNEQFYIAGKPTWNSMAVSFYDLIRGTGSASQLLWDWATSVYNPVTGQMHFKKEYTTSATLAMLDPAGGVVQVWNLFYAWPQEVNWNDLSTEDDGLAEVNATIRYDYAVKGTDVDTSA